MSYNTFGHMFRVTTWGESHGPAIGCVVDGCPPRIAISEAEVQGYLDKRRPGQSRYTSQRREPDTVRILSGVVPDDGGGGLLTTGTPIAMTIDNDDVRSKDYDEIQSRYRPGHADYTYMAKYGKLDQDIAAAMMSINAVKGVEIGAGFGAASLSGEENADEMRAGADGRPLFLSNNAGGILGGIATGQPIVVRFAVKPTSSILT